MKKKKDSNVQVISELSKVILYAANGADDEDNGLPISIERKISPTTKVFLESVKEFEDRVDLIAEGIGIEVSMSSIFRTKFINH